LTTSSCADLNQSVLIVTQKLHAINNLDLLTHTLIRRGDIEGDGAAWTPKGKLLTNLLIDQARRHKIPGRIRRKLNLTERLDKRWMLVCFPH